MRFWLPLAISIHLLFSLFLGLAQAQAAATAIPVNPEFAYPGRDTPHGAAVNSASLVDNANAWNSHVITFTGEAIGEAMVRGKWAWIHLNDDAYMWENIEEGAKLAGYNSGHAAWIPAELATKIRFFGDFKHNGDVVKIVGVFNAACPQHGGDMDIHADSLEIVRFGHPVVHIIHTRKAIIAAVLLGLALILHRIRIVIRSRYAF